VGDVERPRADAECRGATQRSSRLVLGLGEVLENFSLYWVSEFGTCCTKELLNNKILPCCTDFPTLGFSRDYCPK